MNYYQSLDPKTLINPEDLLKPFPELVKKAQSLKDGEAPSMLISTMLSLALEIEIGRRNTLVVVNPNNPDPITLPVPIIESNRNKILAQKMERQEILNALRSSGWIIIKTKLDSVFQLTINKLELANT